MQYVWKIHIFIKLVAKSPNQGEEVRKYSESNKKILHWKKRTTAAFVLNKLTSGCLDKRKLCVNKLELWEA